jgi:hypothetical protein
VQDIWAEARFPVTRLASGHDSIVRKSNDLQIFGMHSTNIFMTDDMTFQSQTVSNRHSVSVKQNDLVRCFEREGKVIDFGLG